MIRIKFESFDNCRVWRRVIWNYDYFISTFIFLHNKVCFSLFNNNIHKGDRIQQKYDFVFMIDDFSFNFKWFKFLKYINKMQGFKWSTAFCGALNLLIWCWINNIIRFRDTSFFLKKIASICAYWLTNFLV